VTQEESGDNTLFGGEIRWTGFGNVQAPIGTFLDCLLTLLLQISEVFGQALERAVGKTEL
jgi:hypothetical protein